MNENLWHFIGTPECAGSKTLELMSCPHHFHETVTFKTERLEQAGLAATSLLPDVYLFRDLVRDVLSHRYRHLSFLTFAHICVALDYFVTVVDAKPDHETDGLFDDIQVFNRTRDKFKDELDAYQKWREQHPPE